MICIFDPILAVLLVCFFFFFFKQKTAYEMRISDWSSDVCSSDLAERLPKAVAAKMRIAEINSDIDVEAIVADVNHSNVESLIDGCDLVLDRSEERRVGQECVSTCRSRWSPYH